MPTTANLRSLLVARARRHGLIGVGLAVVQADEPPEFECIGVADPSTKRAIEPSTVFRIASISKTMTAIGIMQLRDEGRLDLDDPVNRHLETFTVDPPAGGPDVTIRHLLTHTSGIGEVPRIGDLARREVWGDGRPRVEPADLASIYRGALHTDVAAGSKWAYANHAFAVLGQVVEDLTGEPFARHMHQHLFAPLGMEHTGYVRNDAIEATLATGSHWMFGRFGTVKDYDLSLLGPGSVLSSLSDMARYAEWLVRTGAPAPGVLAADTLQEMMSPQFSVHPGFPGMGLAFWLDHLGPHRTAGHDGNVPGFASALLTAPDDGVGVIVLTNTASFFGAHVLATELLSELLGVRESSSVGALDVPERPELWPGLVGNYAPARGFLTNLRTWQMLGGEVSVVVRRRRLVLRSLALLPMLRRGVALQAVDRDDPYRFVAEAEGLRVPVAFDVDSRGTASRVIIGPPSNTVFHRRPTWRTRRLRSRVYATGLGVLAARRLLRHR